MCVRRRCIIRGAIRSQERVQHSVQRARLLHTAGRGLRPDIVADVQLICPILMSPYGRDLYKIHPCVRRMAQTFSFRGHLLEPNTLEEPEDSGAPVLEKRAVARHPQNKQCVAVRAVMCVENKCVGENATQNCIDYDMRSFPRVQISQKTAVAAGEGLLEWAMAQPDVPPESVSDMKLVAGSIERQGDTTILRPRMPVFVVLRPSLPITDLWQMIYPDKDTYRYTHVPSRRTVFPLFAGDIICLYTKPAFRNPLDQSAHCASVLYCLPDLVHGLDFAMGFYLHSEQAVDSAKKYVASLRFPLAFPVTSMGDGMDLNAYASYRGGISTKPQKPLVFTPKPV